MGEKKKAPGDDTVAVRIAPELRRRAKVYAARVDMGLTEVINEAVKAYLDAAEKKGR